MRAEAKSLVRMGAIDTTTDVAEVAKLASKLNYDMNMTVTDRDDEPAGTWVITLGTRELRELQDEIQRLVIVQAVVRGSSVDTVLEDVRRYCARINHPTASPLADGPGVGGGVE